MRAWRAPSPSVDRSQPAPAGAGRQGGPATPADRDGPPRRLEDALAPALDAGRFDQTTSHKLRGQLRFSREAPVERRLRDAGLGRDLVDGDGLERAGRL